MPFCVYKMNVQAKDQEGRTPLHYAAALHDSGIFYRYLLKCGADELIQDKVSIYIIRFRYKFISYIWTCSTFIELIFSMPRLPSIMSTLHRTSISIRL